MKRKMLVILCMICIINLSSVISTSGVSETKVQTNTKQDNSLDFTTFDTFNDVKQRSYYFYDMITDYFEVQDFMRSIYGNAYIDNSPQYRFLTLAKKYFDRYYETNDINDLDYGITYLFDHHVSVGNFQSYHVNYRIRSNTQRSYVPSTFNKDQFDIGEFMSYVSHLA